LEREKVAKQLTEINIYLAATSGNKAHDRQPAIVQKLELEKKLGELKREMANRRETILVGAEEGFVWREVSRQLDEIKDRVHILCEIVQRMSGER
jgi:hypothetical protein